MSNIFGIPTMEDVHKQELIDVQLALLERLWTEYRQPKDLTNINYNAVVAEFNNKIDAEAARIRKDSQ